MSALPVSNGPRRASLPALELTLLSQQAGLEVPAAVDDATARALLRSGDIEIIGRMPWSSNATFLVTISNQERDAQSMLAIYKPRHGERPLWDFHEGTLCQREVAACVLSDLLGWSLIPDTVLRDGPAGIGSVARFYDHNPEEHYFEIFESREPIFKKFAAFDVLANNTDRKGGHVLLATDGHVWGIDHGVCFHEDPKLRTVIWEFGGEPVPHELRTDIERIIGDLATSELAELLTENELAAIERRARRLLSTGRYPMTVGDYRDHPWPLV